MCEIPGVLGKCYIIYLRGPVGSTFARSNRKSCSLSLNLEAGGKDFRL